MPPFAMTHVLENLGQVSWKEGKSSHNGRPTFQKAERLFNRSWQKYEPINWPSRFPLFKMLLRIWIWTHLVDQQKMHLVTNIYLAVLYSLLPLCISGSQTVIQYIRDQMSRTPFVDVAAHPPCGQSTSSKPGFSSRQATPHWLPMLRTLAFIFKRIKNQAKLHSRWNSCLRVTTIFAHPRKGCRAECSSCIIQVPVIQPHDKLSAEKQSIWCVLL